MKKCILSVVCVVMLVLITAAVSAMQERTVIRATKITELTIVIAVLAVHMEQPRLLAPIIHLNVPVAHLANTYKASLATAAPQERTAPQPVVLVPVPVSHVLLELTLPVEQQVALHAVLVVTQALALPIAYPVVLVIIAPQEIAVAAVPVPLDSFRGKIRPQLVTRAVLVHINPIQQGLLA